MPTLQFESSLDNENNLVLKDTSDYTGVVVSTRYFLLDKSNGEKLVISHPIADGNSLTVPIDKDYAFVITLAINYNTTTGIAEYTKGKNVLVHPTLSGIIYDLRKKLVDLILDDDKEALDKLLNKVEFIASFEDAAVRLLSTDIVACQKALDMGNDQANGVKCEI